MKRILCIHLPNWPIQRLLAANRELDPHRPIVLFARDPRRGQVVAACNAAARNCGVRPQLPLVEAATLAEHGGPCHVLPADEAADRVALARLAEHCERFSPRVGWETAEAFDYLLLDVTGIGILFGGEAALAQGVVGEMARLGYTAKVAIADSVGAAWAWAKFKAQSSQFQVLDFATANLEGGTLSLEALRLPAETVELLTQLGVTQISQLRQLPRASLAARFGEFLLLRLDQLFGDAQELIVPHRPPPRFVVEEVLEYPAENRDQIERIVRELVGQIARALAPRREGAVRLLCRLDCAPGRPVLLQVGMFRPSADPRHLWELLRMQLEETALPGPVGRVTLTAPLTAPLENRQKELFAGNRQESSRQLELLIDRLSGRLGPEAVLRPEPVADPLPERAVQYVPLLQAGSRRGSGPRFWPQRPLLLRSPPLALATVSIVPDGPPVSFRFRGQIQQVARWWGPERIESGWWRGRSQRRDYYRVETTAGCRYWIFRRLPDGQWFLQGEFA